MGEHRIKLIVNDKEYQLEVRSGEVLLNVIRDRLGLTGAKYGCGIGECGACTVLMEGRPVLACLVLAVMADGKRVVTIEGLRDSTTKVIQDSFLDHGAVQCGFCTPGMITMARSLLQEKPSPTESEIKEYIRGNICRCTGYISIQQAIKNAGEKLQQEKKDASFSEADDLNVRRV
jgi:carbon-monoxide dehydrogenase small subunit